MLERPNVLRDGQSESTESSMKNSHPQPREERGVALALTLLIVLAMGALATGAALVGANQLLINRQNERYSALVAVAESGLEHAQVRISAERSLYPDGGYSALESGAPVSDPASGSANGLRRSTYVGPSLDRSRGYGVSGTIVTVVTDDRGGKVVRRSEVTQESFAKFAYFTDVEPSNVSFGGGDAIFGPVHTNDHLKIYPSGAYFYSSARTAKTVQGAAYGHFADGYSENAPVIPMPTTAELDKLRARARAGSTHVVGNSSGASGRASTRLEFIAVDVNSDGDNTDEDEGFMRVYQSLGGSPGADYVSGLLRVTKWSMHDSRNCGLYDRPGGTFTQAARLPGARTTHDDQLAAGAGLRRCYLGGADSIYGGFTPSPPDDPSGQGWVAWPGTVHPAVAAARATEGDAAYLWPINGRYNPDFEGVVFVDGKVGISGVVRGRITVAATDDIILLDDLTYATDPGLGTCEDVVGLFSGDDVRVAENPVNTPWRPSTDWAYYTFDDTKDEFIHAVVLALDVFTVESYAAGSGTAEPCEGLAQGRGCLYLTGGVIQKTRGAVGTTWSGGGGAGYVKRYAYDPCAAERPPPYFPTTGRFSRVEHDELNPEGFDVERYFAVAGQSSR